MEDAALTEAYSHARRAADETSKTKFAVASTEHDLAAEQYLKAAEDTTDLEALRILKLLEEHHRKLAQIVRVRDQYGKKGSAAQKEVATQDDTTTPIQSPSPSPATTTTAPERVAPPSLSKTRDTPSSLAKDIASRRGIPQTQQRRSAGTAANVSPVQATGRITTPTRRATAERLSEDAPPFDKTKTIAAPNPDDAFTRFYSNLTHGPFSKLSSMLAFAGLPLTDTSPEDSPTASKIEKTSARVYSGPDVDQIFSKAALKALEEQQRHPGHAFGPGESFYVIPTSGGTASYANIVSRQQQGGGSSHRASGSKDEVDEFVDAQEILISNDARTPKQLGPGGTSLREEELQIENAALKQILDKLSHRLQAFESHAQDASMQALAQSMAGGLRPGPGSSMPAHELEERMRAMEAQLEREMKEREKLGIENMKNKQVIAKYRSHWEQLKDSARAREKAKREKQSSAGEGKS